MLVGNKTDLGARRVVPAEEAAVCQCVSARENTPSRRASVTVRRDDLMRVVDRHFFDIYGL